MSTAAPELPRSFAASWLCEAFQITAAERPDAVALRTPGGGVEISWAEYADRVRRIAGGLAALGVGHGDTVALMMTNRPEFNLVDTAAMHLGATPYSIYNTSAPDQISYLFSNADNRVIVCERQFLDVIRAADAPLVEHVVVIDGEVEGTVPLTDLETGRAPASAGRLSRSTTVALLMNALLNGRPVPMRPSPPGCVSPRVPERRACSRHKPSLWLNADGHTGFGLTRWLPTPRLVVERPIWNWRSSPRSHERVLAPRRASGIVSDATS
jgi:AMP-binding enzyme